MNTVDDTDIIRRLEKGDQLVLGGPILQEIVARHWRLFETQIW